MTSITNWGENKLAKKKNNRVKDYKIFYNEPHIVKNDIGDYNTANMQIFGVNVVMARHVPSVIDGLKPGERRALYAVYKSKRDKKTSMIDAISETLKIHPHGDASVYGILIGMGQKWKNMVCPLDDMGENYGCVDGFSSKEAAPRYLDVKLSKFALDCFFDDFDERIVDMRPSYNGETAEPLYLPAKYPTVFINGASGMAFGYSVYIPYYNIRELLYYTIKLIEDPNKNYGIIVPDSPVPCEIVDKPGVFKALQYQGYTITKGKADRSATFRMRSIIEKDEENHTLTIRSLPPQCSAEKLFTGIKALRDANVLTGCRKINNNTQDDVIDVVLSFKDEVDLDEARSLLYSTKLMTENDYPAQVTVIDDMKIKRYSVRDCLLRWIEVRRDFKRRYYNMRIVIDRARVHVLDILMFLFAKNNAERTLKILKNSEDKEDIIRNLIDEYDIDTVKAEAVANMRNYEYSKKARRKFADEKEELEKRISKNMKIVLSDGKIDEIIIDELKEGIEKYSKPRKAIIVRMDNVKEIPATEHKLVITENGFVKKMKSDVKVVGNIPEGDVPMELLNVNNRDSLIIFDSAGMVHTIQVNAIRGCDIASHGTPLSSHATIGGAKVIGVFVKDSNNNLKHSAYKGEDAFFVFTTKRGLIKKTAYSSYVDLKSSVIGTIIKKGDELISVEFVNKNTDIVTYTYKGMGLRYNLDDITETKRMSSGVKAFNVDKDDVVCNSTVVTGKDEYLLIITMKGYAKKMKLDNIARLERRSDPSPLIGLHDGDLMMFAKGVTDKDTYAVALKLARSSVFTFNVGKDVPEQFRLNKGTKLVPVKKGDTIIKIKKVK